MDIHAGRLEWAKRGVEKLIAAGNRPAKVEATLERAEALRSADMALTTILAGNTEVWRHDIEIPKKYGVESTSATRADRAASSAFCARSTR